ncbi:MAG: hypothetical protein FJZ47_23020 [Candidatus Tectomicrobia bacterium]|uniref:CheW-like domain-containing protein n=1 Tax=Tectimicrobiota bacterium TaxID=2528274 RepID=A0A938B2Y2_UNCTE|nr:hypothetical protein [Candidatus Tectomicrobia bacterium]
MCRSGYVESSIYGGEVLSVIDMRTFLGMAAAPQLESSRLLVVQSAEADLTTALVVDHIIGIAPLTGVRMALPEVLYTDTMVPYIRGIYEQQAQALALFDLERFLLSPELRQFQ